MQRIARAGGVVAVVAEASLVAHALATASIADAAAAGWPSAVPRAEERQLERQQEAVVDEVGVVQVVVRIVVGGPLQLPPTQRA